MISDWNKNLTITSFYILRDKNLEYKFFIITNIYNIGIDNFGIKLVI